MINSKYLIILIAILFLSFGVKQNNFAKRENNYTLSLSKKDSVKTLRPKDLNVKSFISLFSEKYNKTKNLNIITLSGSFPDNWVKEEDIEYLISIIDSKQKCCSYVNIYSSFIPNEDSEIGGYAILFLIHI